MIERQEVDTRLGRLASAAVVGGLGLAIIAAPAAADQTVREAHAWAWGDNADGQLGDGTGLSSAMPVTVDDEDMGRVTRVAAGQWHAMALTPNGSVWAWGENLSGELGDGTTTDRNAPVAVLGLEEVTIVAIAAGNGHSLALDSNGAVWAWGQNSFGELGDGTTTDRSTPVPVQGLEGVTVVGIAAGNSHSLALDSTGAVWAWGNNSVGQLGDGTQSDSAEPVQVGLSPSEDIVAIAAGTFHNLALTADGRLWAWGFNQFGQLGNDSTEPLYTSPVQTVVPCGVEFVDIAAGFLHSLAVDADGAVWAWGSNSSSRLGLGEEASVDPRLTPVQTEGLDGIEIVTVAAGDTHSLALAADGVVWAWGGNGEGQLGDGTTDTQSLPVTVCLDENLIAISAGGTFSLGLVWEMLTIQDLIALVQDLETGGQLNQGQARALPATLVQAIRAIDRGQTHVAIRMLKAFINQTNGFINGGILTPSEGQTLIDLAELLIDDLQQG